MVIALISNTILKPFPSPSAQSTHTTYPKVPLSIFDKIALDLHVAVVHAFSSPMPSIQVLKNALTKALTYFPLLAGRLTVDEQGRQSILLNNAGIRLIETYVPTAIADFDTSIDVGHLHPPQQGIDELLQIQLNRYSCGGLALGYTHHHRAADGQSFSSFLVALARLARGLDLTVHPSHERASHLIPRNPPRVEFSHHSIEFEHTPVRATDTPVLLYSVEKLLINFSSSFINSIKAIIAKEIITTDQRYTTFECLLTHVWKKVTQARALDLEQYTKVRIAVNGRRRTNPKLPMEYFGNLVLFAYPKLTVREVLHESYAYVAKVIHDAVTKIDDNYFKSIIDFGELCKRNGEELEGTVPETGNIICPNLEVDSWLSFNFHDLDFGGGPCRVCCPNIPVEGVVVFLPSSKGQGNSVDVIISLLPDHAKVFKKISHALELLNLRSFY